MKIGDKIVCIKDLLMIATNTLKVRYPRVDFEKDVVYTIINTTNIEDSLFYQLNNKYWFTTDNVPYKYREYLIELKEYRKIKLEKIKKLQNEFNYW